MGPISVALSKSLMTENVTLAAQVKYEQNPPPPAPVSVNAWTGVYEQMMTGRILGNLVV